MLPKLGNFQIKTRVVFGRGALSNLGQLARESGAGKYLLVADPALEQVGILDKALSALNDVGITGEVYKAVEPEPYMDNAEEAAALGRAVDADLVVGLGGGSAMDTAKAAAVLITNEGKAEDYIGLNKVELPGTPTIMVPTTAGTGAEVTFTAVFTNRETRAKGGINSPFLFPGVALLDPELTLPLPPHVTAATGMDALTHAIESVSSLSSTVFTEALALTAIRLISGNLRRAVFHGDDIDAREQMLMGSLLGGLALADAGVGAAHALAYPLGGNYRIPHGLANAMLIPYVMEFNLPAAEKHFAMIASAIGEPVEGLPLRRAAEQAVESVFMLCSDIGIPSSLADAGVPRSDIPMLVEAALKVTRPVENNPRKLGEEEAQTIYEMAFS
ncbi:iron-containing alcohol dehydrogenase [Desulfomonile tiedjei]|uniref:Alcohol dehydrogenase, class IV n=1 Tax=Desulfomonile tiedjei (strain ATCC 49306 / DSM 6799 / DCB-1) TaxID=706587 RepID=I4C7Q7_DESTA|nr:iron-containing alcohol dehydrogenase [Desulfomonile tiedjei]AFM25598.1 alcohol dehydrogenase, class IV [Desulfomonile tiedjei DSM 6799]